MKPPMLEVIATRLAAAEPPPVDLNASAESAMCVATVIFAEALVAGVSSTHVTAEAAGLACRA